MVPETTSPYDAGIADVETRIRSMQAALETLKQLRASYLGEPTPPAASTSRPSETEVQHDTFFGMTIADAARKYLNMMKATKSTADIAAALELGGLKHSSKDFPSNVRSIIGHRDDFIRVPNGDWGLMEWYPGQGRGKKPKATKTAKRKAGKRRKAANGPTLEYRIVDLMKTDANKDWVSSEVAKSLGAQRESVQSTLSRLAKEGKKITKAEKGYRLVKLGIAA
jgi:biotin operon repressor